MSATQPPNPARPYLIAAAPLILVAVLAPVTELMLRDAVGGMSGMIAANAAAIPAAMLSVRLARASRRADAEAAKAAPAAQPTSTPGAGTRVTEPSSETRLLLIVLAGLGLTVLDLCTSLIALGTAFLFPINVFNGLGYFDYSVFYNGLNSRALPLFLLGTLAIATGTALRVRVRVIPALINAVIVYAIGNILLNILISSAALTFSAIFLGWWFVYVTTALLVVRLGAAIASHMQPSFDAAEAARIGLRVPSR